MEMERESKAEGAATVAGATSEAEEVAAPAAEEEAAPAAEEVAAPAAEEEAAPAAEEVAAPAAPAAEEVAVVDAVVAPTKKNRIQVSTNKKPLYFYVNLAKRYMQQHDEIELSALGMAIGTVVTVAEILKNNGLATEKKILTSTVGTKDDAKGRLVRKARIEILLHKSENFDKLVPATKADQIKAVQQEIEA